MKTPQDWELSQEIRIAAPPERVFRALTDPTELTRWWRIPGAYETTVAEVDLRVGGGYRLSGTSVAQTNFVVSGVYRVIEPPRRLCYSWTPDWDDAARDSVVDFRLEPDGDGTRLLVTHIGFLSGSSRDGHLQGWPAVLEALRGHAEGTARDSS